MIRSAKIHINGIVQGVGFRPFVYRVARTLSLKGTVLNLGDAGVRIIVEGEKRTIETFLEILRNRPPSISRIDSMVVEWSEYSGRYSEFLIEKSQVVRSDSAEPVIPPDIAICDDCIKDLFENGSRWKGYPFTSCAACGPRFSTILKLPYDRPNTTMNDFPLCSTCNTGYTDPLDRRYHAQTTACGLCGPKYSFKDNNGNTVTSERPIRETAKLLRDGKIVAIQGISGTHLVVITSQSDPLFELRKRKNRHQRPLAIMMRSTEALVDCFDVTSEEYSLLTSWRRPIVLVKKRTSPNRKGDVLPVIHDTVLEMLAPGLDTVGVMLPYAPVHHLLFQNLDELALVMTSANPTGIPMYVEPSEIQSSLVGIADYYLIHNRKIQQRADDSVVKFIGDNSALFIRRARGYTPEPIPIRRNGNKCTVLGLGPEEKVMGAILKSGNIYPTQYIGNVTNVENIRFLENAYHHLSQLIGAEQIDAIACDLHPEFFTSTHAESISSEWEIPLFRVQHHHAHMSSLIADHKLPIDTSIVCITADGYGYGLGGIGWGGEVLMGSCANFVNKAGLHTYIHPGGDLSAEFGSRPLIGILKDRIEEDRLLSLLDGLPISKNARLDEHTLNILLRSIDKKVNTIMTSSAGRYLDAVAAILGICDRNTYDGESPMKLEAVARRTEIKIEPCFIQTKGRHVMDLSDSIQKIIDLKERRVSTEEIAYAAQWGLGNGLATLAAEIAEESDVSYIGFSGGVALNRIITKAVVSTIEAYSKTPLIHSRVPPGDGGVSVGQVMVSAALLERKQ